LSAKFINKQATDVDVHRTGLLISEPQVLPVTQHEANVTPKTRRDRSEAQSDIGMTRVNLDDYAVWAGWRLSVAVLVP
jgi:hypothetical protein